MMYHYGFDMWGVGGLTMILFWVVVVALAVWGLKMLFSTGQSHQPNSTLSALDIAKTRYSRGEISREGYFVLLKDLEHETGVNKEDAQRGA